MTMSSKHLKIISQIQNLMVHLFAVLKGLFEMLSTGRIARPLNFNLLLALDLEHSLPGLQSVSEAIHGVCLCHLGPISSEGYPKTGDGLKKSSTCGCRGLSKHQRQITKIMESL